MRLQKGIHKVKFKRVAECVSSRASACVLLLFLGLLFAPRALADDTFVFAVQISAVVQVSPPQITLNWEPDPFGAVSFTIYRKAKNDTAWGAPIATLSGTTLTYTDYNVVAGSDYEYQIIKTTTNPTTYGVIGYHGYGYIWVGINSPMIENRGKLLLVVATNATATLGNELAQLQSDLVGDGWQVIREDVSSNDYPQDVRTRLMNDYHADPANVNALFLFGHVPILESGSLDYDGHGPRPMASDSYYGEMNNDWPTNAGTSPSFLPSPVVLEVGRVDLFNMPGVGAVNPWPSEVELLRNYLNKDHKWRTHQIIVQRRALMGNRRGDIDGPEAMAASGYRNFEPFVGPGNTIEANIQDTAPPDQRWISMLAAGTYLWAFGDGGGVDTGISALGLDAAHEYDVYSTDVVGMDAQVPFVMAFASHIGDWDHTDNFIRSFLATPTMGLACFMPGRPHWYVHHMGLGETIGYDTRLSMNNSTLYLNESNGFTEAIYVALMGDPTLRLEPVAPPSGLSATPNNGNVVLNWSASTDPVVGYHVYRSTSPTGPFTRLTSSLVNGTTFTDFGPGANTYTYMVRAVQLQNNFSGSYYDPSQGIFATAQTSTGTTSSITLTARMAGNGLALTWTSQPGVAYHIQYKDSLQASWADLPGSGYTASGSITTWVDTTLSSNPQRFYQISSP
jgi:hypothetical protein